MPGKSKYFEQNLKLFNDKSVSDFGSEAIKVIYDDVGKQMYAKEEISNSVILGDALEIIKKFPEEIFDMVFIDPPYFLQLPKKELRRWKVKTIMELKTSLI